MRGCLDSTDKMIGSRRSIPFKIGVKPVVVKAKGKGKCPKKYSNLRVKRKNCNKRRCRLDEVCVDRMDIVFAVDGSGSLGENGFETFKNFTSELASKMMPKYFTWPAVKVGAVVFGNGGLVKQKVNGVEKTMIRPAKLLTPGGPISDMKKVVKIIEEAKWQKGFVNMGQGTVFSHLLNLNISCNFNFCFKSLICCDLRYLRKPKYPRCVQHVTASRTQVGQQEDRCNL